MALDVQIEHGPDPSADEAAAMIAAIERFLHDTTVAPAVDAGEPRYSGWVRAALREGIGATDPDQIW